MKPQAIETVYFAFESDFVDTFRCIPMVVRYKLDTSGIKLQLPEWVKLSVSEKAELASRPCFTPDEIEQYRQDLIGLVRHRCRHEVSQLANVDAVWEDLTHVPDEVQQKAAEWNCGSVRTTQWVQLNVLQRFALVKLSRSSHEGRNFPRAVAEFGL